MERLCFVLEVNFGQEETYDSAHRDMPPEVRDALTECGYSNYTIFRVDGTVIGYAECEPDVKTVLDRQLAHPVIRNWGEGLSGVPKSHLRVIDPVWRL